MNRLAPLLLAAVASTGCIITAGSGPGLDMTLDVTFQGRSCAAARVGVVRLTFVNPVVGVPQDFRCDLDPMSILVPALATGTYRIQLEAFDSLAPQTVLFSDTFDLVHTAGGTHEYALDLGQSLEVMTQFTFAGLGARNGLTCAQAKVATVALSVDGGAPVQVACNNQGRDAAVFTGIPVGRHSLRAEGYDAGGVRLYASDFPTVDVMNGANDLTLNLLAVVKGGLELAWRFGARQMDCAAANVATVEFQIADASGKVVYTTPAPLGCDQQPVRFDHATVTSALDAGLYVLTSVVARGANGNVFYQAANAPVYAPAGRTEAFIVALQ